MPEEHLVQRTERATEETGQEALNAALGSPGLDLRQVLVLALTDHFSDRLIPHCTLARNIGWM